MLQPVLFAGLLSLCVYRFLVWPLFVSPLAKIPVISPLARLSSLYITWIRWTGQENVRIHDAHKRLGNVVLVGPNELVVNTVHDGISTVYGKNFEKDQYYVHFANFNQQATLNMFSMLSARPHGIRKRMVSHVYAKSAVTRSSAVMAFSNLILGQRLIPFLYSTGGTQVEILSLLFGVSMDFITHFCVGSIAGTDFTRDDEYRNYWLQLYDKRNHRPFYLQNMPDLGHLFSVLRVSPFSASVKKANREMEEWVLNLCDTLEARIREGVAEDDEGIVFRQLQAQLIKEDCSSEELVRIKVASELMDHVLAGHETTAIVLTYTIYHLSKHPDIQEQLRQELSALSPDFQVPAADGELTLSPYEQLDQLPLLQSIMMETLRLNASIPGLQPRRTPKEGCRLGDFDGIPGNVRVSSQAYSLHREETVFEEADVWMPRRWLDADEKKLREMQRWFWAFGSGGRMCIGSNLAQMEMKLILASIYSNFRTLVTVDNLEQADGYTVGPKAGRLDVVFKPIAQPWQ